jgi:LPS sulfotransferase NodH
MWLENFYERTGDNMAKYTKFIILSTPRSGSNYLSSLHHRHPDIVSYGEMYNPDFIHGDPGAPWMGHIHALQWLRKIVPIIFLKLFIFRRYTTNIRAVGFKAFYYHLDTYTKLRDYLVQHKEVKIIHLMRRNLLEKYTSLMIARKTDVWVRKESDLPKEHEPIYISYHDCLEHFILSMQSRRYYSKLFNRHAHLDLYYEDLVNNQKDQIDKLLGFLDVQKLNLKTTLIKQNRKPLSKLIVNYSTLKKKFNRTQWSRFYTS